jgi:hypothetical protein
MHARSAGSEAVAITHVMANSAAESDAYESALRASFSAPRREL